MERKRLPPERAAITHKFSINGYDGYITVGMYEEGNPGEIFVKISKTGSTLSGMIDCWAIAISMLLQGGMTVEELYSKFSSVRFEPLGFTNNELIPQATSIVDYIFKWLHMKFSEEKTKDEINGNNENIQCEESEERGGVLPPQSEDVLGNQDVLLLEGSQD